MRYETTIGLEVHVQLKTRSKLFCSCRNGFGRERNTLTCPVCTGQPGALPAVNREALHLAVTAGLALDAAVPPVTHFDRKNYFYPDLPKGYQISQFSHPVAEKGFIEIAPKDGASRRIGIARVVLEEDAGKTIHVEKSDTSLVDLNRCGVPLVEIVSEPEIRSPGEARSYLLSLKRLMQYIEASDCDMEKGSLRCDANVSIRPRGQEELGTRTEIKNLNSFRNVEKSLAIEIERQAAILEAGGKVLQETRTWRESEEVTAPLRSKEESRDYRYFPEPDIPPFPIPESLREELRARLPENPVARERRFISEFGLACNDAAFLIEDRKTADFFEACAALCGRPVEAALWIRTAVKEEMNRQGAPIDGIGIEPLHVARIIEMKESGAISHQAARRITPVMAETGKMPEELARELNLLQVSDDTVLEELVESAIARSTEAVTQYRRGKESALNALVGEVMRSSGGRADPHSVRRLLLEKLSS